MRATKYMYINKKIIQLRVFIFQFQFKKASRTINDTTVSFNDS